MTDFAISADFIATENAPRTAALEEDYAALACVRSAAGASTARLW